MKVICKKWFLLVLLIPLGLLSQNRLEGTVLDKLSGEAVSGVDVFVVDSDNATLTDDNGAFQLDNLKKGDKIEFSYVGFRNMLVEEDGEITVSFVAYKKYFFIYDLSDSITVYLEHEDTQIEEVVINVGYGTQKKVDLTGAIAAINSEVIRSRPVVDILQGMQGKIAGVDITSNERPGGIGEITVRGVRSLTASNSPLYVVDGIPLTTAGIEYLNTTDIESVDVLKDASASAIYGSRAANGVVIITTKKGTAKDISLNYTSSITIESLRDKADLMNAAEYIEWRRWAEYYSNPTLFPRGDQPTKENDFTIFLGSNDPSAWLNIEKGWEGGTWNPSKVKTTDWTKLVTRTGYIAEHTISASGGNEKMKGYGSFGYLDNQGSVKGQSYKRYTSKISFDIDPVGWFSFGGSINTSYGINEYGQSTVGANSLVQSEGLYSTARMIFRYAFPYDLNGNRVEFPGGDFAVKTVVDEWKYSQDQRKSFRTFGSFYSQFDFHSFFPVLKGLKYRINFGPDFLTYQNGVYIDEKSAVRAGLNYASLSKEQTFSYTLDNLLYYDNTFGKHDVFATLLLSQTEYKQESNSMDANSIPFASQKWNALSANNVSLNNWNSALVEKQLLSYMARLNYSFDQKYLMTLSGRYDGASQLSPGNKWSFFPSAAFGWLLNREQIINQISWIDLLKFRCGLGIIGNSAINPYATKGGLETLLYPFNAEANQGVMNSATFANQNLGWEKTSQVNFGIDFSFLGNRLSGGIDFYSSKTNDLIMRMPLVTVTGYTDVFSNVGKTSSKGTDLTLTSINLTKNQFRWSSIFSGSWQENNVVSLANGKQDDINNNWFIGKAQDVIYGFQSNGIWKEEDAEEMAKFNAKGANFSAGNARPVDQNGDYIIDVNNDRVIIGNSRPKFIVGLTNKFEYKNFALSVFMYGRLGYMYDSGGENQSGRFNQRKINYYTENNKNSEYQKPIYSTGFGDIYSQILGYGDASFIKVRNISLNYTFSDRVNKSLKVNKLEVYGQILNPGTIYSKIKWLDMDLVSPEWNRGLTMGMNVGF